MAKLELLTVLYSVEELLKTKDAEEARERALNVIQKVIKEAETASR